MAQAPRSLRQVLTGQFLAVGLLPLLAVALLTAVVLVPLLVEQARQRQQELAVAIRDQVSSQLVGHLQSAQVIAPHIAGGRAEALGDAPRLMKSLVEVDTTVLAAYVADARGEVKAAAIRPGSGRSEADAIGLDISAQPYFVEARRRQLPVWSDVFVSTLTGRLTAMLVVPQAQDTLLMELSLESLSHALAAISRDRSMSTTIVDRQGRIVAHPDVALALQQNRLPTIAAALPTSASAPASLMRLQSSWIDDHVVLLPVQPIGWTVVVSQPMRVTLAPALLQGAGLAVIVALTGSLALVAARRYAQRTSGQVERLAAAAGQVAQQERLTSPLAFEVEELDALWKHLLALFGKLHDRDLATQAANRDLQSVLDTARLVAIYATDLDGRVTILNQGAAMLLGRPAASLEGQAHALDWHDPQEVEAAAAAAGAHGASGRALLEALADDMAGRGPQPREWHFVRPDGTRVPVSLAITPMLDANGVRKGYLFVGVDVSARQRAAELEVAHRVAQLASQAKSEFLSKMSHELRTPLNAILGFAELLQTGDDDQFGPTQRQHLRYIQEAGWHLLELIGDVLDLARIESGSVRMEKRTVPLGELMPKVARLTQAAMSANSVRLNLDPGLARQALKVVADETRLTQVLVNLLSNAAKYNRPGGTVDFSCAREGQLVLLCVRDTGRGMSEEQLSHLFEPFNRLGHERSRIEGTGIGLVITKHLVELMGGTLTVRSQVDVGTVFTLTLPLANDGATTPDTADAPAAHAPASPPPRTQRVLYVEDNEVNVSLMRAMLQRRPGIQLEIADCASAALEKAGSAPPDLILLDMHLPDADGLELLRRLRRIDACVDVPVIAVTADASSDRETGAMAEGALAYLRKPLRLAQTLEAVDEALSRHQARLG